MTTILNNRVGHPSSPNTLSDPAHVIGQSLLIATLELAEEAQKKGLNIDWSSFEVSTDVDYIETRTISGADDVEFEIRTHRLKVRAEGKAATS